MYARTFPDPTPAHFRFDVVTKAAAPTVSHLPTQRDEDRFLRLEALVETVTRMVRCEHFLPSEQSFACGDCPYGEACAAWHRSRARAFLPATRAA